MPTQVRILHLPPTGIVAPDLRLCVPTRVARYPLSVCRSSSIRTSLHQLSISRHNAVTSGNAVDCACQGFRWSEIRKLPPPRVLGALKRVLTCTFTTVGVRKRRRSRRPSDWLDPYSAVDRELLAPGTGASHGHGSQGGLSKLLLAIVSIRLALNLLRARKSLGTMRHGVDCVPSGRRLGGLGLAGGSCRSPGAPPARRSARGRTRW